MNKKALMLTLGHNSSALYFDGEKSIGYEEERLDGIKASSAFPIKSVKKLIADPEVDLEGAHMLVSHWYDNYDLDEVDDQKHLDTCCIDEWAKEFSMKVTLLNGEFTHHDAHAYSSLSFLKNNIDKRVVDEMVGDDVHFIVADGFGNRQEVISIYKCDKKDLLHEETELKLLNSIVGYEKSLGLMYQYATAFCGMKMNQDEYKFLGYESHIDEFPKEVVYGVETMSKAVIGLLANKLEKDQESSNSIDYINVEALGKVKDFWFNVFNDVVESCAIDPTDNWRLRVVIGRFIQSVIEKFVVKITKSHNMQNVCVSGGIFYNVKLNNSILENIHGKFSVIPLAGDQGAGIGMYEKFVGNYKFGDLCYGKREKENYEELLDNYTDLDAKVLLPKTKAEAVEILEQLLREDQIVNFVEGDMEFGPRALCHTSTLALPTKKNVEIINTLNKRNTVMPMAPVMLEEALPFFFKGQQYGRVIGSDRYMIITYDYRSQVVTEEYLGVMHKYPGEDKWSGRPQTVKEGDGKIVRKLLEKIFFWKKCLINTSYNAHGNPILYDAKSVLKDFAFQVDRAKEEKTKVPYLVVYNGD